MLRLELPQIHIPSAPLRQTRRDLRFMIFPAAIFLILTLLGFVVPTAAQARSPLSTTWTVTIVLPPKVVAGKPATLAVFGVDGRLASDVAVEISSDRGNPQSVITDRTGRAYFTVPSSGSVLLARATGGSAAALIDSAPPAGGSASLATLPVVSVHDRFSICGTGLRGDADAILVRLNGEPSLVVAASPECIVVLPSPKATPGPARVSIEASGNQVTSNTTLVSLEFESPNPAFVPDKKGRLVVHARGSGERLHIAVDNQTPGVLRFLHGDVQEVLTSGGPQNSAAVPVQVIRSGDFSFHARLLTTPDAEAARRYLESAQGLAPRDLQRNVGGLAGRLARHPRNPEEIREDLEGMLAVTIAGDFRTLLEAARSAL